MTFIGRFFRGGSGEPARIVGGKLARIVSVKQWLLTYLEFGKF